MAGDDHLAGPELRETFEKKIVPFIDDAISDEPLPGTPVLLMVGAQPGAGKTEAIQRVAGQYAAVEVNGDDLRVYHPRYEELMRSDPLRMPQVTSQASGAWVGMSLDYLRERGASVVVETTLNHADANAATLRDFRSLGYRTELVVLAVPEELSLMGVIIRYVRQVMSAGNGRWSDPDYHDQVVRQMPLTVRSLIESDRVDTVSLMNRDGDELLEADVPVEDDAARDEFVENVLDELARDPETAAVTDDQRQLFGADLELLRTFLGDHPAECGRIKPIYDRLALAAQKMA